MPRVMIVNNYLDDRGGAERICLESGYALAKDGLEVAFFGTRQNYKEKHLLEDYFPEDPLAREGNEFISRDLLSRIGCTFLNRNAGRLIGLALDKFMPDIVHFHNIHYHLSPIVIETAYRRGICSILTHHDTRYLCSSGLVNRQSYGHKTSCRSRGLACLRKRCKNNSIKETLLAITHQRFNRVTAYFKRPAYHLFPSFSQLDLFAELSDLPKDRLMHMPNFILDDECYKANNCDLSAGIPFRLLFIGRLDEVKGLSTAIRALAILASQGISVSLDIAGEGREQLRLMRQVDSLGIRRVNFLGRLNKYALGILRKQSDALIVPSIWFEPFGLTIIEAFRDGLPVIGSRAGAIPEILEYGRAGVLFEPENPIDLANAIRDLIDNPSLRSRLIKSGAEIRGKYTIDSHVASLKAIYNRALAEQIPEFPSQKLI